MNNYNEEPRLIFKDIIHKNLIGPGSDVFVSDTENEIISDHPLSRYYSGILFPERDNSNSVGEELDINLNTEYEDDFSEESLQEDIFSDEEQDEIEKETDNNKSIEYTAANQYFPTNFGLTFCVPKESEKVKVCFSYARYEQLDRKEAVVEVEKEKFINFREHPYNPIKEYLRYENGVMFFDEETYKKGDLSVRNLRSKFSDENQTELKDSEVYKKVELLLGRLWKRTPIKFIKEVDLTEINTDGSKEFYLDENKKDDKFTICYFKKILETNDRKYVKILLANRNNHPKKKFSFSNEGLNHKALFQAEIKVLGATFLPYKQLADINPFDEELNTINFLYRHEFSFAIGHGCAVQWNDNQQPTELKTTFLPEVDVKNYSNALRDSFPRDLEDITEIKKLSIWTDWKKEDVIEKLKLFAKEYAKWIDVQKNTQLKDEKYRQILDNILEKQKLTYERLVKNINFLDGNTIAYKAFLIANTAMYIQMLVSNKNFFGTKGVELREIKDSFEYNSLEFFKNNGFNPKYRPFQLAFFLLNIEGIVNEKSDDRKDIVDLLWFPTGGGKTEAYLAITAFTIVCRRLLHKGNADGVSVIMRYTLRLLTAQQFERATKLILALDFLSKKIANNNDFFFGNEKVSIGMWVGGSTTPNTYKEACDIVNKIDKEIENLNKDKSGNFQKMNTFPITNCPWCGCNLVTKNEFQKYVQGYEANNKSFKTNCQNPKCAFHKELPVLFVDETIYETPPTLLFATVDKFAMLPHREEGHKLFNSLDNRKLPPDLIIQDELHLLNGPLGSITGLFETIVEMLCTRGDKKPKIIASTATTRNTEQQVAMLYGNRKLNVFPPQGVTYDDNFFSYVSKDSKRKHIGFMPTGKTVLQTQIRILSNLLLARIKLLKYYIEKDSELAEGKINDFWTIVSYYNSLRDVGKIYNKISAEVISSLKTLHNRYFIDGSKRYNFNFIGFPSRVKELTSRVESNLIKKTLTELETKFSLITNDKQEKYVHNTVDLVLASNMFSVGIDIDRLNVMLMNGQPKNIAEYIQASSRVGRKEKGLVLNLLDANRSRDKSYYENFVSFNNAYYKFVEPLSVTPFTSITLDKVLVSLLVCYIRHKKGLNINSRAKDYKGDYKELKVFISNRIKEKTQLQYALNRLEKLSDSWKKKEGEITYKDLIKEITDLDDWSLMKSMREVDTNSIIKIAMPK